MSAGRQREPPAPAINELVRSLSYIEMRAGARVQEYRKAHTLVPIAHRHCSVALLLSKAREQSDRSRNAGSAHTDAERRVVYWLMVSRRGHPWDGEPLHVTFCA